MTQTQPAAEEVASQLPAGMDAQRAIAAVMCTLSARLPLDEARQLPRDLQRLWASP
jgi:uncharacterized protein (DUF2267 family)